MKNMPTPFVGIAVLEQCDVLGDRRQSEQSDAAAFAFASVPSRDQSVPRDDYVPHGFVQESLVESKEARLVATDSQMPFKLW